MFLLQASTTALFDPADLKLIAPELILTVCACVALVMEVVLPHRLSRWTGYFTLVGFAHGTSHFFHFVLPPLFPYLMREFGLTFTEAGALMTVFFVVSGTGQALAGFIVDRFGALRVLCAGVALLSVSALLLSASASYAMLFAATLLPIGRQASTGRRRCGNNVRRQCRTPAFVAPGCRERA